MLNLKANAAQCLACRTMIVTITKRVHQDSERVFLDPVRSIVKLGAMLKVLIPVNGEQKITDGEKIQGVCCVNACSQCTVTPILFVCGVVTHVPTWNV